jgi:hypothetical protein
MTTCEPRVTELPRADRLHIAWDTTGITDSDTAEASLENGPWLPLTIGTDKVVGYFAGPDFPTPGSAVVITRTSWARLRITTSTERLTFDGGFIQLVP